MDSETEDKLIEESATPFKALDFVSPIDRPNKVGIITEISPNIMSGEKVRWQASIEWIGGSSGLKSAWWTESEVIVLDSLPRLLVRELGHPFGQGKRYDEKQYPK